MLKIGIDIRNIGKKRTGDEVVFFELVKGLAKIVDNETNKNLQKNSSIENIKFYLFTDIKDKDKLEEIEKSLGVGNRKDFEIVSLTPSLIFPFKKWERLFNNKFIWNLWTLPKHLRKHLIDVYHTQYVTPFFMPRKIKIITHIHDVSFKVYKKFIKWSDLFFLSILIPLSLKRADKIIAVSEFTRSEILKYYRVSPEKVEVVYNSSRFAIRSSQNMIRRDLIEKKYGLPREFILYIGTLQPRKNIPRLIEAYEKIKNKIPDIKLVIAGNTKSYNFDRRINEIMKRFQVFSGASLKKGKNSKDIIFPGFIDEKDKMDLIAMARVFVLPSLYEGFGIPILEAMNQNIPVAASDIPSFKEVGGEAYVKFNPLNLDEIAEKLYDICVDDELRKKIINLGRSRIVVFSWDKSAKKMLEIYKN